MEPSLRHLRYFVAVAEELNFTRAAERLHIAQPSLSTRIQELERQVGCQLLRRTTREVQLTDAGEVLLAKARPAIAFAERAIEDARDAEHGRRPSLRLGHLVTSALELTTPILETFRAEAPDVELDVVHYSFDDPSCGLSSGTADVALTRLPVELPVAESRVLFGEPLVFGLHERDPLCAQKSVTYADLEGRPLVWVRSPDRAWTRFWRDPLRARAAELIECDSIEALLEAVADGRGISVTGASMARFYPRPGVRFVPISDAPRSQVAVVWRGDVDNELVSRFADVAVGVRDRERTLVAALETGRGPPPSGP